MCYRMVIKSGLRMVYTIVWAALQLREGMVLGSGGRKACCWHRHRVDGPALEYGDGGKMWYQNDTLHRLDGPAVELQDGHKEWFKNGVYHRLGGPAVERGDGSWEWWEEGLLLASPPGGWTCFGVRRWW